MILFVAVAIANFRCAAPPNSALGSFGSNDQPLSYAANPYHNEGTIEVVLDNGTRARKSQAKEVGYTRPGLRY